MEPVEIPIHFLGYAAGILGKTSGPNWKHLAQRFDEAMVKNNINVPSPSERIENKREKFIKRMRILPAKVQYHLIKELCDEYSEYDMPPDVAELRAKLIDIYGQHFEDPPFNEITKRIIEVTKHWLSEFPRAEKLYLSAEEKWKKNQYHRNLVDDLRLSLETMLKEMFQNAKSLENQMESLGKFLKSKQSSTELRNMFTSFLKHFSDYQNSCAKHNDAVPVQEIEIIFELTSILMKHLMRLRKS